MPKLKIDNVEIEVEAGTSILQAAEQLGVEVPRFCYHERMSVPANCRMCLVELKGSPKPVASCAMPCGDNMEVFTDSDLTRKARKGVMEMLLINHPLDCPICDQGGECDLQDQALGYGFDRGRFAENKRAVQDKYMGPLIKTIMTRCIHCTRCIRFCDEIAGVSALGAMGRSEHMEIGTYIEAAIGSELSGNLADVCPVGALTHKPYAYTARPWELRKTDSIDVMDAVGSNIRVDARGAEVMRVLPRLNEDVNEEWLADKSRWAVDGLTKRRLDRPFARKDGKLQPVSWSDAVALAGAKLKQAGAKSAAIVGDLVDAESILALKDLMTGLGSSKLECRQSGEKFDPSQRAGWLFNPTIAGLEQADVVLIVGSNPRWEAPLIDARLRKRERALGLKVAVIGPKPNLTYPVEHLGTGADVLQAIADGTHPFAQVLKSAQRPVLLLGSGATERDDGLAVHALARRAAEANGVVKDGWNGFAFLHRAAARVGALELGFAQRDGDLETLYRGCESGEIELVYLLGADEIDTSRLGRAFVIYQGHHGDVGAHRADLILAGAAWTEKHGTYVNTEGRAQLARQASFPPGEAREDWKILRAVSEPAGATLPYDTLGAVRKRLSLQAACFANVDRVTPASWASFGRDGAVAATPFVLPIDNYYMTDPVSRASPTMAACVREILEGDTEEAKKKTGTHG
ncbi:MAG: NADH-quinone oxidoreductase subunit [Rhodospirillales bacterium]|nr:NADH-quinone oxidoreductase subunit [Rhodospirillales bacterium]